jgi:hypothetical protein
VGPQQGELPALDFELRFFRHRNHVQRNAPRQYGC